MKQIKLEMIITDWAWKTNDEKTVMLKSWCRRGNLDYKHYFPQHIMIITSYFRKGKKNSMCPIQGLLGHLLFVNLYLQYFLALSSSLSCQLSQVLVHMLLVQETNESCSGKAKYECLNGSYNSNGDIMNECKEEKRWKLSVGGPFHPLWKSDHANHNCCNSQVALKTLKKKQLP